MLHDRLLIAVSEGAGAATGSSRQSAGISLRDSPGPLLDDPLTPARSANPSILSIGVLVEGAAPTPPDVRETAIFGARQCLVRIEIEAGKDRLEGRASCRLVDRQTAIAIPIEALECRRLKWQAIARANFAWLVLLRLRRHLLGRRQQCESRQG